MIIDYFCSFNEFNVKLSTDNLGHDIVYSYGALIL